MGPSSRSRLNIGISRPPFDSSSELVASGIIFACVWSGRAELMETPSICLSPPISVGDSSWFHWLEEAFLGPQRLTFTTGSSFLFVDQFHCSKQINLICGYDMFYRMAQRVSTINPTCPNAPPECQWTIFISRRFRLHQTTEHVRMLGVA